MVSGSPGRTRWSWPRELMPNLANTLRRWYWTVRGLMNSRVLICGMDSPSQASRATWAPELSDPPDSIELTIELRPMTARGRSAEHVLSWPAARRARQRRRGVGDGAGRPRLAGRGRRGVADHRRAGPLSALPRAGAVGAHRRQVPGPGRVPRPGRVRRRRPRVDPDLAEVADPDRRRRRFGRDGVDAPPVGPPRRCRRAGSGGDLRVVCQAGVRVDRPPAQRAPWRRRSDLAGRGGRRRGAGRPGAPGRGDPQADRS